MMLFLYSQLILEASEPETWLPTQDIPDDIATAPNTSIAKHELL